MTCTGTTCTATSTVGIGGLGDFQMTGGKFTSTAGGCTQSSGKPSKTSSCTNSNSDITCQSTNGSFASSSDPRFDTYLPSWFETNGWQNYLYYHATRPAASSLSAGARTDVQAMVASTGRSITSAPFAVSRNLAQARPSCSELNNYFDSAEGADADTAYDAVATRRTASYNDKMFTITP